MTQINRKQKEIIFSRRFWIFFINFVFGWDFKCQNLNTGNYSLHHSYKNYHQEYIMINIDHPYLGIFVCDFIDETFPDL